MVTHSRQKNEPQPASSYLSNFQVALTNWYLWQLEQAKARQKQTNARCA